MLNVFIGYDPREAIAYHVCANSLIRHATQPLAISPLALKNLGAYAETHTDGSNQFIYSRFLVPHLMGYKGWALFVDGDMLLRDDVAKLFALCDDSKAVMCVHHDYKTKREVKYLGAQNQNYPRKNWSSVVLWNCGHPSNAGVTPEFVMNSTGAQLHRFTWLRDDEIGELPKVWNWLPDEFGENRQAKLLHWTLGTPCFHEFAHVPMAEEWHREKLLTDYSLQRVVDGPFEGEAGYTDPAEMVPEPAE
ncbi:glycosyltransferase [Oceanicola sp. 22II-s10i]|uniref:glycosyltransferase n=1 Tax=Oceanicola sp. 22II-s10i TaxID=1317116 RepID=UPI000B51F2DA|nr:glycosyltransferase [Oceanicola sp. 22II-s10i]